MLWQMAQFHFLWLSSIPVSVGLHVCTKSSLLAHLLMDT